METHKALKPNGKLIIVQPDKTNILAHLRVNGRSLISEIIEEPEFNLKKDITYSALHRVIDGGLFLKCKEIICPDMCEEFESLESYEEYAYDVEDRRRFISKVRKMKIENFVIWEYFREYRLLLEKVI